MPRLYCLVDSEPDDEIYSADDNARDVAFQVWKAAQQNRRKGQRRLDI